MRYLNAATVFVLAFAGTFVVILFVAILPQYFGREPLLGDAGVGAIGLPIATVAAILAARRVFQHGQRLSLVYYWLAAVAVLSTTLATVLPMDGCGGNPEAVKAFYRNNLKQIGLALQFYAEESDGYYPLALEDLYPNYVTDTRLLEFPFGAGKPGYAYVAGLRADVDPSTVVAFDRKGNHKDGSHVLFASGRVKWMPEPHFQSLLLKQPNAEQIRRLDAAHSPTR